MYDSIFMSPIGIFNAIFAATCDDVQSNRSHPVSAPRASKNAGYLAYERVELDQMRPGSQHGTDL